jgi:hypothetical protein
MTAQGSHGSIRPAAPGEQEQQPTVVLCSATVPRQCQIGGTVLLSDPGSPGQRQGCLPQGTVPHRSRAATKQPRITRITRMGGHRGGKRSANCRFEEVGGATALLEQVRATSPPGTADKAKQTARQTPASLILAATCRLHQSRTARATHWLPGPFCWRHANTPTPDAQRLLLLVAPLLRPSLSLYPGGPRVAAFLFFH